MMNMQDRMQQILENMLSGDQLMNKNRLVAKQIAMRQQMDSQKAYARSRNLPRISATSSDHRQYAESDASLRNLRPIKFQKCKLAKCIKDVC